MLSIPRNTRRHPACCSFCYKVWNFVTGSVSLQREMNLETGRRPELDDPVENRLPVMVTGEIIISDEKVPHALGVSRTDDLLYIACCSESGLPALHVDDGAEAAIEGASTACVKTAGRA